MNYYNIISLLFKNGEWVKYPGDYTYPFDYADAGIIHTVHGEKIYDHIKWFHNEDDKIYVRDGVSYLYEKSLKAFIGRIKRVLGLKRPCGYFVEVGLYKKDDVTLYIFRDFISRTNVSFYTDGKDAYILFGEGDCCRNILTGLIDQGKEYEFEQGVANEIYNWCYDNALTWVSDLLYETNCERIEGLRKLQDTFAKKWSNV